MKQARLHARTSRRLQRGFTNMHIAAIASRRGGSGTVGPQPNSPYQVVALFHCEGTNGSTTLTDSSLFAETMVPHGNAQISTTGPAIGSACALFDGAGDNWTTTLAGTPRFDFAATDFTIEARVYTTVTGELNFILSNRDSTDMGGWYVYMDTSNRIVFNPLRNNAAALGGAAITGATSLAANTWYTVAIVRIGTSLVIYLNGVADATLAVGATDAIGGTDSVLYVGSSSGEDGTRDWKGRLDEIRIVRGQGLYTTTYTPNTAAFTDPTDPGAADPNFAYVTMLLPFDGTNGDTTTTDKSPFALPYTGQGGASLSNAQTKFSAGTSYLSAATKAWSRTNAGREGAFQAGPFSIEFWCYPTTAGSDDEIIASRSTTIATNTFWLVRHTSANKIRAYAIVAGTNTTDVTSSGTLTTNAWNFVQVIRQADGHVKIYIGATGTTTVTNDSTTGAWTAPISGSTPGPMIACNADNSYANGFKGYVYDLRVTKGIVRPIAVPSAAFPISYL